MPEQLTLDLFPDERREFDALGFFLDWAHDKHGCGPEIDEVAAKVFDTMPHPFDRCKALLNLCGTHKAEGYDLSDVELLGVFDVTLDYHTCWDRSWGAWHGVPKDVIARIHRCEYRADETRYYDADGELVCTSGGMRRKP